MGQERKLRVGVVFNSFEPVLGGGHVHLVEVVKRWNDFDITIFAPEIARRAFERDLPGKRFVALPSCEGFTQNRLLVFLYRSLSSVFAASDLRRCDALICQSHFLPDVVPALVFGPKNATATLWHVLPAPWKREGNFVNNSIAFLAERAGLFLVERFIPTVIVGSRLLVSQMPGLRGKQVYVTTNGVDHLQGSPAGGAHGQREGGLFIGRVHPAKGIDDLIDAWEMVVQRLGPQKLTIVGQGLESYEHTLRARIQEKGLGTCVILAGNVSEADKRGCLERAAVFLFPSKEEGWGIALAEAMASGLPCVTYDLDIFREVFPRGRLHARIGDVQQFAKHAGDLLADPAFRAAVASDARELSGQFSWANAAAIEARALMSLPNAVRERRISNE